jgi:hypothetical protein
MLVVSSAQICACAQLIWGQFNQADVPKLSLTAEVHVHVVGHNGVARLVSHLQVGSLMMLFPC